MRLLAIAFAFSAFTCSFSSDAPEDPADEAVFAGDQPVYPDNAGDSLAGYTPTVVFPPATSALP